jgi:hypothetical protein
MKESSSRHSKYCKCITCIRKINGCHPKDCKCPFCYQKKIGHSKEKIACIICGKIREGYNGTVGIKCRKCEDLSRKGNLPLHKENCICPICVKLRNKKCKNVV